MIGTVLLGEFSGNSIAKPYLKKNGWGRMWASYGPQFGYDCEPWGIDNGAYAAFRAGKEFNTAKFVRRIAIAKERAPRPPCVAVLPDVVGNGMATLSLTEEFLSSQDTLPDWPWFLAVQDGTCPERARRLIAIHEISGVFLGGSDDYKATAHFWSRFAKTHKLLFHFGRCNRESWLRLAMELRCDSIDTVRPVRALTSGERSKFLLFEQIVTGRCPQRRLPI